MLFYYKENTMSVNKVIMLGRLGDDPELKYTPKGDAVLELRLATNETWTDKNKQKHEKTEWHTVVFWNKQAETLNKYLVKGNNLFVEGKLETRSWDAKDGSKRYKTEIRGFSFDFVGPKTTTVEKSDDSMKQTLGDYKISDEVKTEASMMHDEIPF